MNMCAYLTDICTKNKISAAGMQLPDCELDPAAISAILINETPPQNPNDGFYSSAPEPADLKSALALFESAGAAAGGVADLLHMGLYLTTAVKTPKFGYAVEPDAISTQLPILVAELALFPNLRVIMLMGDTAKKAVNLIHKAETRKNLIPAEATYKIRGREFYWKGARVLPSYIMTGGNILIEKSKRDMIAADLAKMLEIIKEKKT